MVRQDVEVKVYVEIGEKRTFATALDWPGWCRGGRDESSALQALFDYGPRYARVLQPAGIKFNAPTSTTDFAVFERQTGNATTDFGAPNLALPGDTDPVEPGELQRWQALLQACWQAFDVTVIASTGKTLSKGPRGGGRELENIVQHVQGGELGYLTSLGGNIKQKDKDDPIQFRKYARQTVLTTLEAAVRGEVPQRGPRGGLRWTPRYFVRRAAWHVLDHAWEIEDRAG